MTPPFYNDSQSAPPGQPRTHDNRKAFAWAVAAHVLLVLVLVLGMDWHSETPGPVQVELWADGISPDAQPLEPTADAEPTPQPVPELPAPHSPPPPVVSEPEPPPPPPKPTAQPAEQLDPEIALEAQRKQREKEEAEKATLVAKEKARLDAERKQAELIEKQRLEKARAAVEKAAADKKATADKAALEKQAAEKEAAENAAAKKAAAEKAAAEKQAAAEKAAAAKKAAAEKAAREQALKAAFRDTAMGAAGIPGGSADRNQSGGGRDSGYGARVRACVQPRVIYPPPPRSGGSNPTAQYQVQLGSGSMVTRVTLTRSSGNPAFDSAVERGIRACSPFPRPTTGDSLIDVNYRMYD